MRIFNTRILRVTGILLILGTLIPIGGTLGEPKVQSPLGKIALVVTHFDTEKLEAKASLDMSVRFEEEQYFDWLLMYLVHIDDQNRLQEVSHVNLTKSVGDSRNFQGAGELVFELKPVSTYPFDEYNMTIVLYDGDTFNKTRIESPRITVNLKDQMRSLWLEKEKNACIRANRKIHSDDRDIVHFSLVVSRQPSFVLGLLLPIYLSLIILCLTSFLSTNRRDWLSNRIGVYVSLFVFVFAFQSVILANAPLRLGISLAELLIYVVAIGNVVLFFISVVKSYFLGEGRVLVPNRRNYFFRRLLTFDILGLALVALISLGILWSTFGTDISHPSILGATVVVLLIPILMGAVTTKLRARQFKNVDYLFDYVTIAISEGLVSNIKEGINHLVNAVKEDLPNYEKEMPRPDSIIIFLSDLLIANVNTTYIRETILNAYKDLFVLGASTNNAITYTIAARLRMLSEQIARKENALASRRLLMIAHELFNTSIKKKFPIPVIDDANASYQVISRDIMKEEISSLFSYDTLLIGSVLRQTVELVELEHISLGLLDLLEECVTKCVESGDTRLARVARHYAQLHLDAIHPKLKGRNTLQRRVDELVTRAGLT